MASLKRLMRTDFYLGGLLFAPLKITTVLLGMVLRRLHESQPKGRIIFLKVLGGGSLVLAYPAILSLKRKYPRLPIELVTTPGVKSFAATLNIFDRIHVIENESVIKMLYSSIVCLLNCMGGDTFVNLEVHSRLASVFSILTLCRNRFGFFSRSSWWVEGIYTHLIFYNVQSPSYAFYDSIASIMNAPLVSFENAHVTFARSLPLSSPANPYCILAFACSDNGTERMLNSNQWVSHFRKYKPICNRILLLGGPLDRDIGQYIAETLSRSFPQYEFELRCGQSLNRSIELISGASHFVGIDSALLHYARLLKIPSISYWGPTDPKTRLRPHQNYLEATIYKKINCSPCIHYANQPPCRGDNICISQHFSPSNRPLITWLKTYDFFKPKDFAILDLSPDSSNQNHKNSSQRTLEL